LPHRLSFIYSLLGAYCLGIDCNGTISCSGLSLDRNTCIGNATYGCSWDYDLGDDTMRNYTLGANTAACDQANGGFACDVTELPELCSNGIDDNADTLIDCQDPDCQIVSCNDASCTTVTKKGVSMVEVAAYSCFGTNNYTGDTDLSAMSGTQFHCSNNVDQPNIGVCCPEGYEPEYSALDDEWACVDTAPCRSANPGECNFDYSVGTFTSWTGDSGCLNSSAPLACCSVVQFGSLEYWSDEGNVKIY